MDYQALAAKVFEVYSTKSVSRIDELVLSLYAPKAVFSDNITHVTTAKEIALMFRGLAVTFPTVEVQVHDVSIKNTQTYHCKGMIARLAGNTVAIEVVSTLQMDDQGRITHHQDTWQDRGSMPRFLRSMGGSFTNLMLRMTGVSRKT